MCFGWSCVLKSYSASAASEYVFSWSLHSILSDRFLFVPYWKGEIQEGRSGRRERGKKGGGKEERRRKGGKKEEGREGVKEG